MKFFTISFFILVLQEATVYPQYVNYRLFPSGTNQIEPFIVRHPGNEQILFSSAYTINQNTRSEGIYVSTNGGLNWIGTDICNGPPTQNHGGDPGPIIDKNGIFILTHQGILPPGMYANYSTNQGANWSSNYPVLNSGDNDKGAPGTDDAPSSSFYGRTYLAWTRFSPPIPIVISYTSNSGTNWSNYTQINNTHNGNYSYGPSIAVSPTGTVYVAWASSIATSPFTEDCIGFARSTNGGLNWIVSECAIDCNGIRTTQLSPWLIRANSFPVIDVDKTGGPRNGWIYIAVTDKNIAPAGSDPDIVFHRSTDGGATWSAGVRVNTDPINNGRNQFFPAIRVDEGGGLNIIYYDSRNFADSVDIYLSRSTNGGTSWTDYRITQNRFRPRAVSGSGGTGNMGDNIGITSGNGKLYPVWMSDVHDDVTFQVWSAIIDYNSIGIHQIGTDVPSDFSLKQNYPNPFNPSTKIEFSISKSGFVAIKICDIAGRLIKVLAEQNLSPGSYTVDWDAAEYPSGVYFYSLEAGSYRESKKMILLK